MFTYLATQVLYLWSYWSYIIALTHLRNQCALANSLCFAGGHVQRSPANCGMVSPISPDEPLPSNCNPVDLGGIG
ncbi:hypothetical protein F4805DRAFT_446577 [Annulohypoxylon moriforme]|nr:hypothetical protein F4805DRAFT_446577 [Annulohypoxylon moriforme]